MKLPATCDVATIADLGLKLPFYAQQALSCSADHASAYLREHTAASTGLTTEAASLLAAARLELILRATRQELSGVFCEAELSTLMSCYQAELLDPHTLQDLASPVCDDLGVELDEYESSSIRELVDKLRKLTTSQRVALGDALEQAWHRSAEQACSPREVLAQLGIELL